MCSQGTQNQPPCHDQQSSYQKNVHVFSWIYIPVHAACDIIIIFCVWSGCKAGNHTKQVLATTSCKIVEALYIKIVFTNTVHHQGRTLVSARDFLLSFFHSCPCKFWIRVFHAIVTTFNIDIRGGGRKHVKSILSKFFGFNSYSVSSFLPAT